MTKIINVTSNGLVRQVWNPSLRRRHGYTGSIWWRRAWKRESPRRWSATLNPEAGDCFTIREAKDQKCRMEFHHICDLPPGAGEGSPVPNHQSLYVERWREWRVLMVDRVREVWLGIREGPIGYWWSGRDSWRTERPVVWL